MEAMWKHKHYKYAYICCVLYTYLLTIPNSVSVYWAYGDVLLHHSNAFSVLPPSAACNVAIVAMIAHQYVGLILNITPIFHMWEKTIGLHLSSIYPVKSLAHVPVVLASVWRPPKLLQNWFNMFCISGFVATFVFVVGFGLGGWASFTNFVQQIDSFGFFQACYQCPSPGKAH
ncbi:unnamed protein product [Sphagnum jensenii]|uniref:Amino acid transporter transmembrane domain-containing protein n=1 Tax=Sphagnum jensenii TaxID=128206 RepID=A0ABP1BXZ8_9BRYO